MLTRVIRTLWEDRVSKGDGRSPHMAHSWIRVCIYIINQRKIPQRNRRENKKIKRKINIHNKYINRFVKYSRREEALLAIEEMAGYRIGNKTLMCKLSSSATSPASCNIYIKPLPTSFSEGILLSSISPLTRPYQTRPITHHSPLSLPYHHSSHLHPSPSFSHSLT